jgi:hypothetical protein
LVPGLPGLILLQPLFEECDGGEEVVTLGEEQVDVYQVRWVGEAVGESDT